MNRKPVVTAQLPLPVAAWRLAIYTAMWEMGYHCPWMHILPTEVPGVLTYTFGFACLAEAQDVPEDHALMRHHHRAFHTALKSVENLRPWSVSLSPYAMEVVLGQVRIDPTEVKRCEWHHSCWEHCCEEGR